MIGAILINSQEIHNSFLPQKWQWENHKKNIKKIAEYNNGLIEIKLIQLCSSKKIQKILLSTNDQEIIDYAISLNSKKILIDKRANQLSSSTTTTDELIKYTSTLINNAHILWTHVTSPFVTSERYDEMISKYLLSLEKGFDSLMAVTESFIGIIQVQLIMTSMKKND